MKQGKMILSMYLILLIFPILLPQSYSMECNIQGQCYNSSLLTVSYTANDVKDCTEECKTLNECTWLSFDPAAELCFLFADCSSIVHDQEACVDCVTSQVDCQSDCDVWSGLCLGSFVNYSHRDTEAMCAIFCKNSPDCNWFSYSSSDSTCLQFFDCPTINPDFVGYVSGNTANCEEDVKLLVVTGVDLDTSKGLLSDSEVINLSDSNSICEDLGDSPLKIAGGTGGLLDGKFPVICGGEMTLEDSYNTVSVDDCFVLAIPYLTAKLSVERYLAASFMVNSSHLWVTGGAMRDASGLVGVHDTSDFVSINDNSLIVNPGPILPLPMNGHCMVQIDDFTFMLIGGVSTDSILDKTYIYTNDKWTEGPKLNFRRRDHACSQLTINDRVYVIISGGYINEDSKGSKSIESLDVMDLSKGWQLGFLDDPDFELPRGLIGHSMVQLPSSTATVIGGAFYGDDFFESSKEVLKLDVSDGKPTWTKLNHLKGHGRYSTVAMLVPSDLTSCTPKSLFQTSESLL